MELSDLLVPISEQSPCGPDLDDLGDNDYFNYTIAAESRLPERFVIVETGQFFDRRAIKLDDEKKELNSLLDRSRDIRLLVLMAQFHSVAGDVHGFARTLEAISALISKYWNDVHPRPLDGDMELRRVALEGLNDRAKVLMPLSHAPLFLDRRVGAVSLRTWQVANKPEIAYKDEEKQDVATLRDAVSSPENAQSIASAIEAMTTAVRCLSDIRGRFQSEGSFEHMPAFVGVQATLADISEFLRGDALLPTEDQAVAMEAESSAQERQAVATQSLNAAETRSQPRLAVQSHCEAKAALIALESYFAQNEPSSPALILVHQARLLIGRPLVEALNALAPSRAGGAILSIDRASGFYLDMDKMKQLTIALPAEEGEATDILPRSTIHNVSVRDRREAIGAMIGIEAFLSEREPTSPVTMLLARARALSDSNFLFLLREMLSGEDN